MIGRVCSMHEKIKKNKTLRFWFQNCNAREKAVNVRADGKVIL
jgi:hypothetical protein